MAHVWRKVLSSALGQRLPNWRGRVSTKQFRTSELGSITFHLSWYRWSDLDGVEHERRDLLKIVGASSLILGSDWQQYQ